MFDPAGVNAPPPTYGNAQDRAFQHTQRPDDVLLSEITDQPRPVGGPPGYNQQHIDNEIQRGIEAHYRRRCMRKMIVAGVMAVIVLAVVIPLRIAAANRHTYTYN